MAKRNYVTVAVELTEHADAAADHFEGLGYTIKVEHSDVSFPNAPTLQCRRQATTIAVEIDAVIRTGPLEEWVRYCKSCTKDMRIALESAAEMKLDLPGLTVAKKLYDQVAAKGWEDCGTQALYRFYTSL